jgi:hypothetical protein
LRTGFPDDLAQQRINQQSSASFVPPDIFSEVDLTLDFANVARITRDMAWNESSTLTRTPIASTAVPSLHSILISVIAYFTF